MRIWIILGSSNFFGYKYLVGVIFYCMIMNESVVLFYSYYDDIVYVYLIYM